MTRKLRVFLCHASQDKPAVRKLHRYLKQRGVQPWLDELDLLPGEKWEVEIPNAIFSSDVILVCLSKNSINKEGYVQKEISFALDKALEKPEGTIFIIPVKLEECEVPKQLNRYQWVDLFHPDSNKRLLLGLNKRAVGLGSDVSPVILEDTRHRSRTAKLVMSDRADRESVENATREKLELEAKDKNERETAEKSAPETLELEAVEKEKLEKTQREISQKSALEKENREAKEKTQREVLERRMVEKQELEIKEKENRDARQKKQKEFASRVFHLVSIYSRPLGIGGIILLVLIFVALRLNYSTKNLPVATSSNFSSLADTKTSKPPTSTSVPFTLTPHLTKTTIPTPTIELSLTPTPFSKEITQQDAKMALIPAGTFIMGEDNVGAPDEKPAHGITLDAFYMDKYEVTNVLYKACVNQDVCTLPADISKYNNPKYANHPVVFVDWNQATTYCEWRGARLPTEAEWEYGWIGTCSKNPVCSNFDSEDTVPVGSYVDSQSQFGLYDMAGNVWEWVNDWYSETYYQISPEFNPTGPVTGQYRVLRGGSWHYNPFDTRPQNRYANNPVVQLNTVGFRCAYSP